MAEIIIGLIVVSCIGISRLIEDYKTKDMTSDQRIEYEWKKLDRKYHSKKK